MSRPYRLHNRFVCWLFSMLWARWLDMKGRHSPWHVQRIIAVTGWRSALVDRVGGQRELIEFVMPWEDAGGE